MTLLTHHIELRASQLAEKYSSKRNVYVDVEEIAEKLGLQVTKHDLGENVSGVLYIDKGKGTIGYNGSESPVRRRFTIAHEIAHFLLHRLDNEIFIDKKEFKPMYRNEKSSTGEIQQEREANAFAAALLMPKDRVLKELNKRNFDLSDDDEDVIEEMAKLFCVSTQAMTYRISNLELF